MALLHGLVHASDDAHGTRANGERSGTNHREPSAWGQLAPRRRAFAARRRSFLRDGALGAAGVRARWSIW